MGKIKVILALILALSSLGTQVAEVAAGQPARGSTPVSGTVHRITLETDPTTGVTTLLVEVVTAGGTQTLRLSQETGIGLGLISLDADGKPTINEQALGKPVEIDPALVMPEKMKDRHPVANALAAFFSDTVSYDEIIAAHEQGVGFGVIAQALWLTSEVGQGSQFFHDLLDAKISNDYGAFAEFTEDGTAPKNWGQLRKALLNKKNLGAILSGSDPLNEPQDNKDKDKDKENNGQGNGNGGGNGQGNGNGNGHGNGNGN